MQKADHAGETFARLLIDERVTLGARRFEVRIDAVALEAYMMQPAAAPREKLTDAALWIDRLEQFDLTPARIEERGLHALVRDGRALDEAQAERVTPELQSLFEIRDHHADMMDSFQHA